MKFKVYVHTGSVGSEQEDFLEIPDDEVEGMTDEQLDEYVEPLARELIFNYVDWGYSRIEETK